MARLIIDLILMVCCLFIAMLPGGYARKLKPEKPWFQNICRGNEKFAKIHVYAQDALGGPNQTVYEVAHASIMANPSTSFGQVLVSDDLVTAEPDPNSEKLGRAQGILTFSDLEIYAFTMNVNFIFTSGEYNGSTICILGRNQFYNDKRELAIVGGTGVFRFARGYAITTTYSSNIETRYNVLEYTLFVSYVDEHTCS